MLGGTLGNYRIERELGRGGMGVVYVGTHALLGRTAAVKVLLPKYSLDQEIVQRFFNEARAAAAIKHPGIVEIYDFGFSDGSAYIVMELCEGESLATRIRRRRSMPVATALTIGRQIAGTLAAAHRADIVHRDLKPDNVFVVPDRDIAGGERIKLLDFGIAKLAGDAGSPSKTTTGVIMGTPHYMSPEQCRGAGQVDHRADLYSLGCILFEMVCGRLPFVGEGSGDIIGAHLLLPAPAPTSIAPTTPPEVETLILRLLAKKPADRFADAEALIEELARVIAAIPATLEAGVRTADSMAPTLRSDEPAGAHTPTRAETPMPLALTPTRAESPSPADDRDEPEPGPKAPRSATPPRRVTEPAAGAEKRPARSRMGRHLGIAGTVVAGGAILIGIRSLGTTTDRPAGGKTDNGSNDKPGSDKNVKRGPILGDGGSNEGLRWRDGSGSIVDAGVGVGSSFQVAAQSAWDDHRADRMTCYKASLATDPKLTGVTLSLLQLDDHGKLKDHVVVGPQAKLVGCVLDTDNKPQFPDPGVIGAQTMTYAQTYGDDSTNEAEIYRYLLEEQAGMLGCYAGDRKTLIEGGGMLTELVVDATGRVTTTKVISPRSDKLGACMRKTFAGMKLPVPRAGKPITVAFAFDLDLGGLPTISE